MRRDRVRRGDVLGQHAAQRTGERHGLDAAKRSKRSDPVEQRLVDEGAHRILDQHVVDVEGTQRLEAGEHGLLSRAAAGHGLDPVPAAFQLVQRRIEQVAVVGVDHGDDAAGGVPFDKGVEGMGNNGPSGDPAILLRAVRVRSGPFAAPGGNDDHTAVDPFSCAHSVLVPCATCRSGRFRTIAAALPDALRKFAALCQNGLASGTKMAKNNAR